MDCEIFEVIRYGGSTGLTSIRIFFVVSCSLVQGTSKSVEYSCKAKNADIGNGHRDICSESILASAAYSLVEA